MKKIILSIALLGGVFCTSHIQAQVVLEALEASGEFVPSDKCLEQVKDKYYGNGTHNFIYCAVMGPNGKKWLNLNLGAEYAREASEHFNPEAVPTDNHDWKAFGSLYNFNRNSDGHELVTWSIGTERWEVVHTNGYRKKTDAVTAMNSKSVNIDITNSSPTEIYWTTDNDPCPSGYRVMVGDDVFGVDHAKYQWDGYEGSATILKYTDAPLWNLMIAPAWFGDTSGNINYNKPIKTLSGVPGKDGDTASMWLGRSRTYYGHTRLGWKKSNPICEGFLDKSRCKSIKSALLDRGVYNGSQLVLNFGVSGISSAASVRCVEK